MLATIENMVYAIEDPLSTDAQPAPPCTEDSRPRNGRGRRTPAPVAELTASGLTWVNVVGPDLETANSSRSASAGIRSTSRTSSRSASGRRSTTTRRRATSSSFSTSPSTTRRSQRLNAAELDVFIGPDYLVTIPNRELLPVTRLFGRCESDEALREQLFAKGTGRLLYEVLDDLFDYCFPILDKIGHKLDSIEDDMFEGYAEDVVRDISNVKQEIISYRKVMKPGRSTLRVLERRVDKFLPEELELYFDDIVDAAERIWDQLDNYKEVVDGLESTNESVISHRQNDVLRVLTIFSVILLPLTLISGIFGMNVEFPGFDTHAAFWVIVALMVVVIVGMVGFFRHKRWL